LSACINATIEQSDGTIHANGDIAARDVKASRDLLVREPLVETQLDDLSVGSRQQIDISLSKTSSALSWATASGSRIEALSP